MTFAISLDAWDDRAKRSFLAVNLHSMNVEFVVKKRCLLFQTFDTPRHKAEDVARMVANALGVAYLSVPDLSGSAGR
jgi:hypothetical protein